MAYARGRTLASHGMLFGPMLVDSGSAPAGAAADNLPTRIQYPRVGMLGLTRLLWAVAAWLAARLT